MKEKLTILDFAPGEMPALFEYACLSKDPTMSYSDLEFDIGMWWILLIANDLDGPHFAPFLFLYLISDWSSFF